MKPGLYPDISHDAYHADCADEPSLSGSIAVTLADETARHGWFQHVRLGKPKDAGEEKSNTMDFGSLAHTLILGRGNEIVIGKWDNWKTKDAQAFRDDAARDGKLACLQKDWDRATLLRESFNARMLELGLMTDFAAGQSEVTAIWTVGTPPVWCRCRFDRLFLNTAECIIYDLKISGSASPDWASRNIFDMGYDLKACHLATGLCAVNPVAIGRTKVIYIYVENVAPFCVTPIELTGEYKALGESKYARAMLRWQKGILENSWPEYASSIVRVEPPKYAVIKELGTI